MSFWRASLLLTNYYSGDKSRRLRWTRHMTRMGERVGAYMALLGKPRPKREFGKSRRRWEEVTKIDLQEVGWSMDYIDLSQNWERWRAVVNAVI
jgi:hypothetical protein